MDGADWYNTQNGSPDGISEQILAADSVQEAHRLLAQYPMASATPTTHVARHLSNMTLSASPPSFMQYPPAEYTRELDYLSGSQTDDVYWENTRNQAVAALGDQSSYGQYQPPLHWSHSQTPTQSYHTNPFAQSIFHCTNPNTAYPTPPPPGINSSSSSLAYALGVPVSQPPPVMHQPQQSAAFFNDFLAKTTREIHSQREESPDPLAITREAPPAITPSKRKALVDDAATNKRTPKRTSMMMYVEVPPNPWRTPKKSPDDLGGYSPTKSVRRDDRVPLEKFITTLEDIFEAEDTLAPDVPLPPGDFFSQHSADSARPSLHCKIIRKLTKQIQHIPRGKSQIGGVDTGMLGRVLKMLERSVRTGEELDPFVHHEEDDRLTEALEKARESVLAADCVMALLCSDRLTKQLYSEELIVACLTTIHNSLTKIVYPFVESTGTLVHDEDRALLNETFQALSSVVPRITSLVSAEVVAMSDSIVIQAVFISIGPFFVVEPGGEVEEKGKAGKKEKESVVSKTLGKSAMRGLRLEALGLIRSIFANHENQRSWIIEEILSSLIKLSDTKQKAGQFRLRDGRSIRTVSALLLQLVQTSAHDVRIEAQAIQRARNAKFAMRRNESFVEREADLPFLDEQDLQEISLYGSGLDSATKSAKTIILFLTQRSGKGKATKNSNEAEYRAIFDNFMSDLLAVLFWPEWPAANLLLSIASRYMVSSLDDVKTSQSDNNAAKTIALDHLGVIAGRIRGSALKVKASTENETNGKPLKSLEAIVGSVSSKSLDRLLTIHKDVAAHLCKRSGDDPSYDSARELTAATLGHELASALQQVNRWINEEEDVAVKKDVAKLKNFGVKIKTALREVWKDHGGDVFDVASEAETARVDRLAEEIGTIQNLRNSFQPILNVILVALDAPPIFMRTKALRALGQIVTSDPSILAAPNVRRAIESHLLDSSPAVRDAAVELIGKYMIDSPEVAGDYYQKIAERIADTGLGVRKRVIKLLKSFYPVIEDNERRADLCTRLVLRMLDEDDAVKDLAVKTIEELWFQPPSALAQKLRASSTTTPLISKVAVIMTVSANFKDRQSPLEDMLHKIIAGKESGDVSSLHQRYEEICATLIDGLVDASDLPGFTVPNCVRTIHLFTSAYPPILSAQNATTLLPYLKNATTPEELTIMDYLLKIFRASIPHMPKTAAKFGHELQLTLQPMMSKPPTAEALQEVVACMCIVVQCLTHEFTRLVALLKSCNGHIQKAIQKPSAQELAPTELRTISVLILITALLGEHCDFDALRRTHTDLQQDINGVATGSIVEHVYNSLIVLYHKYNNVGLRGRILECLGILFRAQPTLMTSDSSADIMDAIFASLDEEPRTRLLKIMQDFLISESSKHNAKDKETAKGKGKAVDVNMAELVGNTDDFADSGVSSAVVQRYIEPILDAVLSQNPKIQDAAFDILNFTIKQGLAHPLQSFPIVVALETSPNTALSNLAAGLHVILHAKHTSLLNTRYAICARTSFDYQKRLCADSPVRGFRIQGSPLALLQRWYTLVREKRPARQDFLKALVKVFDIDSTSNSSQDIIDFARYMAENFSAFDYKTQEEVFTVIKYLTSVLSTTGMQIVQVLSPSNLLAQLHESGEAMDVDTQPLSAEERERNMAVLKSSVIVGMIMLLKAHLKALYGLSEDKCAKFVVGKKSAAGDKPAAKRSDKSLSWERLPFATAPLLTTADMDAHKTRFMAVWNEDGLTEEPEDDDVDFA